MTWRAVSAWPCSPSDIGCQIDSIIEGSKCVSLTWRAMFACPLLASSQDTNVTRESKVGNILMTWRARSARPNLRRPPVGVQGVGRPVRALGPMKLPSMSDYRGACELLPLESPSGGPRGRRRRRRRRERQSRVRRRGGGGGGGGGVGDCDIARRRRRGARVPDRADAVQARCHHHTGAYTRTISA